MTLTNYERKKDLTKVLLRKSLTLAKESRDGYKLKLKLKLSVSKWLKNNKNFSQTRRLLFFQ